MEFSLNIQYWPQIGLWNIDAILMIVIGSEKSMDILRQQMKIIAFP